MPFKKTPALAAVVVLSIWMIYEAQHLGGGGKDRSHLSKPPPGDGPMPPDDFPDQVAPTSSAPSAAGPFVAEAHITKGNSLSTTLHSLGVSTKIIAQITPAIKQHCDTERLPMGTLVRALWHNYVAIAPTQIDLKLDEIHTLIATRGEAGNWSAEIHEAVVETQTAAYAGVVTTTLWNSASIAGMDPNLIQQLAEVFAWQVDFNREVQEGDRWRLTVKRHYVAGKPIGFGEIIAAEYENAGLVYTAVHYEGEGQGTQYYMPDGSSLRRMFLKSPIKFGRITSGFTSRRFHPVLKVVKPHLGVDYGAPMGTPVMSVGHGVITLAGRRGGSGNTLEVKHNAVYSTAYKHLSRFAPGIGPGSRVQMGQVIGYVGATGLATGPHLHFEFRESGRVLDPQGIKFPRADPVPESEHKRFLATAAQATSELPPWSAAVLSQRRGDATDGIPNE